jgi:histidine ammonia-lyase
MTDDLMSPVMLDRPLSWREVAAHAQGDAPLQLSANARARIDGANAIVRSVVERGIRAYGVNTGVGALSEVIIGREQQSALSRNIVMSHAVGSGPALPRVETRAIMIASVNLYALGFSGLRASVVETLIALLNADCTPRVPRQGSVGYLSHRAHIGLALLGYGDVLLRGRPMPAARALGELGLTGMTLEAKEGLCLVNGTACVGGLGSVALERASRIMDWADVVAAMTFETQRCQLRAIDPEVMALHAGCPEPAGDSAGARRRPRRVGRGGDGRRS